MGDEFIDSFTDKKRIKEIINKIKNIGINKFSLGSHCVEREGTLYPSKEFLFNNFKRFNLIKLINLRKLKKGDIAYDLIYELGKNKNLTITICFEDYKIIKILSDFWDTKNLGGFLV